MRDVNGKPIGGADVQLELEPSAGYQTPGGSVIDLIAQTASDAYGMFSLTVPTTDGVLAEADYLNGTVNMMIHVVSTSTVNGVWTAEVGAGGIYSQLVSYGPNPDDVLLAPVNVGVVTINDALALTGTTGLPDTPSNDPHDPNTPPDPVTAPAIFPEASAAVPYTHPWVETPDTRINWANTVSFPPTLPETPAMPKPEDPPYSDPDDRCLQTANQGMWLVDRLDSEYVWQPIGEVHSVNGEHVRYHYEERALTTIGLAINTEGKGWKISGGTSMANDGSGKGDMPWAYDTFARHVEGEFFHVHNRKTWCPKDYNPDDGNYAVHVEEVKAVSWQGGLRYGSQDFSDDDDTLAKYQSAYKEGRAGSLFPGNAFSRESGKTFKFTIGVSAFGVGLNAESTNDVKHTMEVVAGYSRESWHMFGDKAAPPNAANHAIYAYL